MAPLLPGDLVRGDLASGSRLLEDVHGLRQHLRPAAVMPRFEASCKVWSLVPTAVRLKLMFANLNYIPKHI